VQTNVNLSRSYSLSASWRDAIAAIPNIDLVEILDRIAKTRKIHETEVERFTFYSITVLQLSHGQLYRFNRPTDSFTVSTVPQTALPSATVPRPSSTLGNRPTRWLALQNFKKKNFS
jgi:hypothetical protein